MMKYVNKSPARSCHEGKNAGRTNASASNMKRSAGIMILLHNVHYFCNFTRIRVRDMWYQRVRKEKGVNEFYYVDIDTQKEITDEKTLVRIHSLHIPGAYENVMINKNPRAKVQAYGYDAKGRKQITYATWFIEKQSKHKYARVFEMDRIMPKILSQMKNDMDGTDEKNKAIAVILYIMIRCGFRVGNEKYANENNSYGLTTLEKRHILIRKTQGLIEIKFIGKKGVENKSTLTKMEDTKVYAYITRMIKGKASNDRVFGGITSEDVNAYLRRIHPNITSKDVRTWNANTIFVQYIMNNKPETIQVKQHIDCAITHVADALHNTRAVCKKNYIHPTFLEFATVYTELKI